MLCGSRRLPLSDGPGVDPRSPDGRPPCSLLLLASGSSRATSERRGAPSTEDRFRSSAFSLGYPDWCQLLYLLLPFFGHFRSRASWQTQCSRLRHSSRGASLAITSATVAWAASRIRWMIRSPGAPRGHQASVVLEVGELLLLEVHELVLQELRTIKWQSMPSVYRKALHARSSGKRCQASTGTH